MPPVVIGVAAAAGATFASYAVATAVAIGVGAAIATYAITEALTPDLGEMENGLGGDQTLSVGGVQGRREIYGEAIVSGNIVGYGTYTDDEEDKWHVMVIPVADHVCESIELHDIEGKLATETGMSSRIKITTYLGGQSTACPVAKRWATGWTSNHIGHGLSYVTIEIKIDAEFFPNGINRMRFKVKGKKLYDVRKDSTNGGSGTHRFTDETTWEWSSNPILATADFIRFGGYKEQPYERFDWADIAAQANSCDEIVSFTDNNGQAASEARFTCNGSLSKEQSPATNLKRLLSSFAGKIYNVAGKIYLKTGVYQGAPTVTIDKSHCKGQVSYKPYTPIKDRCNIVRTSFVNPKKQYQSTDATPTKNSIYKAADGMTLEHKLTLHMTNSETMCQRIGKGHLEQNRAGFSLRIPLMAIGLLIMPGQAVSINMPEDGIDNVEFKCVDWAWDAKKRTAVLLFGKEGSELYPDDFEPNEQAVPGNEFIDAFEMKDFPTDAITWTNAEAIRKNQGVLSWEYDDSDEDIKYKVKIRQTNESWVSYLDSLLSRTPKYTYFLKKTTSEKALEINSVPTGDYEVLVSAINRMGRYSERSKNITITHQPATLKDIAGWNELPNSGADKTNYSDSRIDNDVAAIAAQTKADLAKKQAKAYADGIVSDEEERAITDASEKANAAQLAAVNAAALDATAKANAAKAIAISTAATAAQAKATLAKTEAKAYADGIVTDEEERAIADATAKANAAQSNAISAANSAAQAKADEAEANAKAYADGQFPRYKSLNSIHGTGAITTPQFIIALNAAGAFSGNHNVFKASWNYAGHGYISDTGCGVIDLAGTTIEVIGTGGTYLIRVTSAPSASSHGGLAHTTWEYRNHGSSYNPGWRMILNSGNFQNSVTKPYIDNLDIAASTARKWQTPRTLTTTLTGDVTGSASMLVDGSGNKTATINVSVKDDSHKHVIDNIDHLQAALDLKIGFTDLTYDDVTTYAAAIESVQQFKDWLQSGDADTSAYDLVTPSMATAFINAVIGQFNIVVAAAANIDILDSRLIDVDTLFAKNVITDAMEAKAITADKIDIVNLFAQAITASGSITGAQLIGGIIKTSLATNVDRTIIDGDTIKYYDANQFTPAMVIGTNSVGVARAILELGYTGYNKKAFKAVGATNVGFALATFEQESSGYAAEFIANGVNYGRAILAKSTTKQAALEVSQISSSPSEAAAKFSSSNGHAASFITAASKAPFTVNSSVMVVNLNSYKLGNYTYAQVLSAARAKLGLNADKVDGFHAVKDSYTANQVAVRNSSGDLHARLFRANYTNQSTISGAIAFRVNNGADNYLRYCSSPSAIRTWLDTPEKPVASKTTNGYWKCVETGLIMVWGTATAPANTLSSYVYFPLAFPNACRSLHLTEKTTFTNDLHVLKVNVLEKSRFKAYNTDIARTYTYLAIGY